MSAINKFLYGSPEPTCSLRAIEKIQIEASDMYRDAVNLRDDATKRILELQNDLKNAQNARQDAVERIYAANDHHIRGLGKPLPQFEKHCPECGKSKTPGSSCHLRLSWPKDDGALS